MAAVAAELEPKPIIFVAHSLGGIVVKKALVDSETTRVEEYRMVLEWTKYILFLGTPHRGTAAASWGVLLANISAVTVRDVDKKLLRALQQDSELLEGIQEAFRRILDDQKVKIHSFQELRGFSGVKLLSNKVVPDDSSKVESSFEKLETINANHMEMARYGSKDDDGYNKISRALKKYLDVLREGTVEATPGG